MYVPMSAAKVRTSVYTAKDFQKIRAVCICANFFYYFVLFPTFEKIHYYLQTAFLYLLTISLSVSNLLSLFNLSKSEDG